MAAHRSRTRKRRISTNSNLQRSLFELPEEILDEILKRLPPKPLFKLRSVSKRFKSLVSGPEFYQSYLNYSLSRSQISSGMVYPIGYKNFIPGSVLIDRSLFGLTELIPSPPKHPPLLFHHFKYKTSSYTPTRILASSHGLLLSQIEPFLYHVQDSATHSGMVKLCVSNPLTKQYLDLPSKYDQPRNPGWTCGLATRMDGPCYTNIVFKVVLIQQIWATRYPPTLANTISVSIFSSNNKNVGGRGQWEQLVLDVTCRTKALFKGFVKAPDFSHKGILHWFHRSTRTIVTYDPFDSPNRLGHIRWPDVGPGVQTHAIMNVTHLGHEDDIIRCCQLERRTRGITSLAVWCLVDNKGKWCLEQRCEISSLCISRHLGLLNGCTQVVASDPTYNPQGYFCTLAKRKQISVVHLVSGKKKDLATPKGILGISGAFAMLPLVPFTFSPCPWF